MISKLIVWGRNRKEAIARMRRALYEYIIIGPETNIPFHQTVMENERFIEGALNTHFIEKEVRLLDDMKAIIEREVPLMKRLSQGKDDKKKIAAIAAVTAVVQGYMQGQVGGRANDYH
jgi:pyruvate carboxylase subunit A